MPAAATPDPAGRSTESASLPTREQILLHASRLFAARGFLGTSTREIAAAVGIRQPSMYSHFPTKHAVAEELLRRDLTAGIDALAGFTAAPEPAAVQLYRYLLWEVNYVRTTPLDLRALYLGELLEQPEFDEGRRLNAAYEGLLGGIVARGLEAGEFGGVDVAFAVRAIDAIVLEAIRGSAQHRPHRILDEPDMVATFVVRSLLRDPAAMDAVRAAAHAD
ncbi:MAG: TetR/AcrR family transcriptional regulator [Ilumatobacteraceae bacterium]